MLVIGAEAAISEGRLAARSSGFHSWTVPATVPVARVPFGANASEVLPLAGFSVWVTGPVAASRTSTRPSGRLAASKLPAGGERQRIGSARSGADLEVAGRPISVPVPVRQIAMNAAGSSGRSGVDRVWFSSLAARRLPSGEKASA